MLSATAYESCSVIWLPGLFEPAGGLGQRLFAAAALQLSKIEEKHVGRLYRAHRIGDELGRGLGIRLGGCTRAEVVHAVQPTRDEVQLELEVVAGQTGHRATSRIDASG